MREKILALVVLVFAICSCDDGDVFTVELDFEDGFNNCEISTGTDTDIVFFKTKTDPVESLSLFVNGLTLEDTREFPENLGNVQDTLVVPSNSTASNVFNYRRYTDLEINGSEIFCSAIPPVVNISTNEEQQNVDVEITTIVFEDDGDGIPWQDEDDNDDGDNNPWTNPTDTDNDGIPNYLDADDDGDNVLTKDEDLDEDGDGNPFTNPLNTDGDEDPDYLDTDDDNDGVLTRDEDADGDLNPLNDRNGNDPDNPNLADYLNQDQAVTYPATEFRAHTKTRTFTTTILLNNVTFSGAVNETFDFGTEVYESGIGTTITLNPIFN